jgi:hypothetical protein
MKLIKSLLESGQKGKNKNILAGLTKNNKDSSRLEDNSMD